MNNEICLKSISELLEESFYISSYQRGYRWTEQQIFTFRWSNRYSNNRLNLLKRKTNLKKSFIVYNPL